MSSSDSDEDCYGNAAKTLQNLKGTYRDDKLDSANLLNDSQEINILSKSHQKVVKNSSLNNDSVTQTTKEVIVLDNSLEDDEEIDRIIALNQKRLTRSSSHKNNTFILDTGTPSQANRKGRGSQATRKGRGGPTTRRGIGRTKRSAQTNQTQYIGSGTPSPRRRGNRTRRGSSRNRQQTNNLSPDIITVGDCEEYDDLSNNVQLFSKKNNDVEDIENDLFDENEELSVKVFWQSTDIVKFTIRKYQKISQLFKHFSEIANVQPDKLLFMFNDRILKPDDTPESINYNIAKFIDGGVVNTTVTQLTKPEQKCAKEKAQDCIKIKFQYPNSKKPFEIQVALNDLLSRSMMKCAEHMEKPLKCLKFEFDGDFISGNMTARELEMEGGECIDVKIIN